jgi:GR25 family glycosyltransferase involved in LPS biosynthesis
MNNIPIIVLNLERAEDRKNKIISQFMDLGINNYFIYPAFDAKNIKNQSLSCGIIQGYGMGRKLSYPEISIIISHLGALKFAQMMEFNNVIILEDDVILCKDWVKRLDKLLSMIPEDWEHIYLSGHSNYVSLPKLDKIKLYPSPKITGAWSYMVNKSAYSKIINYIMSFITTYDDMIMHMIEINKLKSYTYLPFLTYIGEGHSDNWGDKISNHPSINYFNENIEL